MYRLPPRSTRTTPLFPYTTLFRSVVGGLCARPVLRVRLDALYRTRARRHPNGQRRVPDGVERHRTPRHLLAGTGPVLPRRRALCGRPDEPKEADAPGGHRAPPHRRRGKGGAGCTAEPGEAVRTPNLVAGGR